MELAYCTFPSCDSVSCRYSRMPNKILHNTLCHPNGPCLSENSLEQNTLTWVAIQYLHISFRRFGPLYEQYQ